MKNCDGCNLENFDGCMAINVEKCACEDCIVKITCSKRLECVEYFSKCLNGKLNEAKFIDRNHLIKFLQLICDDNMLSKLGLSSYKNR